jgi:hypothetical protein
VTVKIAVPSNQACRVPEIENIDGVGSRGAGTEIAKLDHGSSVAEASD